MTDWTTARVVRDRDGDLWFRGSEGADADLWTASTDYPDVFLTADEVVTAFGPIAPVLDADGLPVVTTVGDLTARHIGRRVQVEGDVGLLVAVEHSESGTTVTTPGVTPASPHLLCVPLDTPCEVLS